MHVPSDQVPWWLDRIVVPILFTFFGAMLGFIFGCLKDWLDQRKAKKVFLKAVRGELSAARGHLEGTLRDVTEVTDNMEKGVRVALHLATTFQTGIYSSQIGKLKDVSDPLVMSVIRFYDRLSNLERVKSRLTTVSFELATLAGAEQDSAKDLATAEHYRTTLDEVIKRINQLLSEADSLIPNLPEA